MQLDITFNVQRSPVGEGVGIRKPRPTASRLRPVYLADFLPEKVWRTFYNEVLPDFLAYGFAHSVNRHFNRILI
jgi:hypothetical protein